MTSNKLDKFIFIHVGKCGGTTIRETLENNGIEFKRVHVGQGPVEYNTKKKYLIALRNPVGRFVSAFYWRKHLVCNEESNKYRFSGEYDFLKKFPTIEDLVQDNIEKLQTHYVHHLKEDIIFYLGDFADQCNPDNVIGAICTENLCEDVENIFNVKVELHKKNNTKRKIEITEEARKCVKKYLHKDYLVIEKLNDLKLLSQKQYEILSK